MAIYWCKNCQLIIGVKVTMHIHIQKDKICRNYNVGTTNNKLNTMKHYGNHMVNTARVYVLWKHNSKLGNH